MTARRWRWIAALAVATRFPGDLEPHASAERQSTVPPVAILHDGATFEKTAVAGDRHLYEVRLTEGDFLEINVSQDGFVVAISARAPDGPVIHSGNVPHTDPMPQSLIFVAPAPGTYSIDVALANGLTHTERPRDAPTNSSQGYLLRVLALRPANARDHDRARWFALLERAVENERRKSMDGLKQAVPFYQESASGWRSTGDVTLEALTLEALAHLTGYFTRYNSESIAARERLAELYPGTEHRQLEIHNLRSLGTEYSMPGVSSTPSRRSRVR